MCDDDGHCETSCLLNSSEKGGVEELPHDYSILKAERSTSHRKAPHQRIREYPSKRDEAEAPPSEKANTLRDFWSVRDGYVSYTG